jgi:hypothetical protein
MKKILLIAGILLGMSPALADDSVPAQPAEPEGLDVSQLIQTKDNVEDGCSGESFQGNYTAEHPLQMAAVYVDGCPNVKDEQNNEIGKYLYVADDASIGNDGTLSGVSCELCPTGHECPGIDYNKIEITGGRLSSQGAFECKPGRYSNTTGSAECEPCAVGTYQSANGGKSCTPASAGWYVEKEGSDVQIQCPVGYRAGTTTGGTSIYSCQKKITSSMCDDMADNFLNGTMTPVDLSGGDLFVDYMDVSSHCFGSLSCNSGYHKGNAWQWIQDNPGAIVEEKGCSINNKINDNGNLVDCNNGLNPGTVQYVVDSTYQGRPANVFNFAITCSDKLVADKSDPTIGFGEAEYDDFTASYCQDSNKDVVSGITSEADCVALGEGYSWIRPGVGGYCWMRNIDEPNQPWFSGGYYGSGEDCKSWCGANVNNYPMVARDDDKHLVVENAQGDYYAEVGNNQFLQLVHFGPNTCYDSTTREQINANDSSACFAEGGKWNESGQEIYLLAPNADTENPESEIGAHTYVIGIEEENLLNGRIAKTTGTNGNASFDVCVANPIVISWDDVTLEQNDPARTCTYGGNLITPTSEPASDGSRLFLGWKPVTSTPAP